MIERKDARSGRSAVTRRTLRCVRFTFDHNCLIDLDEERENARHVREIAVAAKSGTHSFCIPASAGAERLKDGTTAQSFAVLQARLHALDLDQAKVLCPLLRVGMGFIGFGVASGAELEKLENDIRSILFPTLPHRLSAHTDEAASEGARPKAAARIPVFLFETRRSDQTTDVWPGRRTSCCAARRACWSSGRLREDCVVRSRPRAQ